MNNVINFKTTTNHHKHIQCSKQILISQGGARSGKSYSILQILIYLAIIEPGITISVVAENIPFLKRGVIRDFKSIMIDSDIFKYGKYNSTDNIFKFCNGSVIEFFSVENPGRALGSARDYLFINECNNVRYETAFQLMARTRKRTFLDFNPVSEFWVHTEVMNNFYFNGKFDFVKSTFIDNEYLDETIKELMLARAAKDSNYKRVYIDGEVGKIEGLIYPDYELIDEIPKKIRQKTQLIGLDWGYHPDPASINEIYIMGDAEQPVKVIYINELLYQTNLFNADLMNIINEKIVDKSKYLIIADSAENKSIDEFKMNKFRIEGITKGAGSVYYGINILKQAKIYITKNSTNTIKEIRNYKYATDKNGNVVKDNKNNPVPIDLWNHSLDNIRYCAMYINDLKFKYVDKGYVKRNNVSAY